MNIRPAFATGFCLLFVISLNAQLFDNASDRLPDAAAAFQTKDVFVGDIDNDGDSDVILANEFQQNVALLNDGFGFFSRGNVGLLSNSEHDSEAITMADFNMDGHNDLIFVSEDDFEHEYYFSVGADSFSVAPYFLPFTVCRAIAVGDLNNDDALDAVLGNNGQNMLLLNDGNGQLQNQNFDWLPFVADLTQDIALGDIDGDGDLDMFVANEEYNFLHINDGTGFFTDQSLLRLPQGLNIDTRRAFFEDVDLDGDIDLFLCNVAFTVGKDPRNRLFLNDGNGYFIDVSATHLPGYNDQSLDAAFTDIDMDGYRDIVVANVLGVPLYCYRNNGVGVFSDVTASFLGAYMTEAFSIAAVDFDGDDFEDLYVCNGDGKDLLLLRDPLALATIKLDQAAAVQVYPNPAQDELVLDGVVANGTHFSLQSLDGKQSFSLRPEEMTARTLRFDLSQYVIPSGIYLLHIQNSEGSITKKVFVD